MTDRSTSAFLAPVPHAPVDHDAVIAREAAFHDALMAGRDPSNACPEAPDPWEGAVLEALGPITGRTALDYGCGAGGLSIQLADLGAVKVTGIDLSPASIRFAQARVQAFRPEAPIEFLAVNAESTGLPTGAFDVVAGKLVLHHLDIHRAVTELYRLLRQGGRGAFVETSGLNPALIPARNHIVHRERFGAIKVGTEDEHPITRADLTVFREHFADVKVDFPIFWLFRPFARQVLAARFPQLGHRVAALDEVVERRFGALRPLSYHVRIVVTKG